MQISLSTLLHHIPYTSITQCPYYLKEINKEPSYGIAFLMPTPIYVRFPTPTPRDLTQLYPCAVFTKSSVPDTMPSTRGAQQKG